MNVWRVLMHRNDVGPFSYESTISAIVYLGTMGLYAAPQKSFRHG
jgi:hypothetical protein